MMETVYTHDCPNCGQMVTIQNEAPDLSDIELDNLAELNCTCSGGDRARWIRDSEEVVENVLGRNSTKYGMKRPLDEDACQFAKELLQWIYDGAADNITFTEFYGDKITIMSGVNKCKVKRISKAEISM